MNKQRVAFYSQGCRLNHSETATMTASFEHEGHTIVPFGDPCDIVIVNTCTVTEKGDADTRRLVNKINRKTPGSKIALVGCQAQILKNQLLKLPNVQWVVGNANKFKIESIITQSKPDADPHLNVDKIKRETFRVPYASIDRQHTRANIKIQDGCDFYCSFCVIPFARGPARSRDFKDIINEVNELVTAGHQEVVITGINLGTYSDQAYTFLDVVDELAKIDGLARIRISSIEPTTIPNELFDRMIPGSKLCHYLHIPLQSGCDHTLSEMARKYTRSEFLAFVELAKEKVPDICVGTDIIVGFPGETDDHFEQTLDFVKAAPIDYMHVFSYSERPLARARRRTDSVPSATIKSRSEQLRDLSMRKRQVYMQAFINQTQDVLFEQEKRGYWTGVTDTFIRVQVPVPTGSNESLKNRILPVRLISVQEDRVLGELQVSPIEPASSSIERQ